MSDSETTQMQTAGDGAPPIKRPSIEGVESALLDNDLSKLSPQQRVSYMEKVCESVGLNPLTKPFRYIRLNGQLTLYATRDAAEQLRKVHGISITNLEETWRDDLCIFRAYAKDADGRTDVATGAVDTSHSSGQQLANDIMKAETKAKRRVTLSLAGLGWLDETEVDDIPDGATEEVEVDYETGEVIEQKPDKWYEDAIEWMEGLDVTKPDLIDHADRVPSEDHPLNDWPEQWWDRALEAVEGDDSGKATGGAPSGNGEASQPSNQDDHPTKSSAQTSGERKYDSLDDALTQCFEEALEHRSEGSVAEEYHISDDQLKRMYAIAMDNGWSDSHLDRLVKDLLGFDSKSHVPYGGSYEEICEALEDDELQFWVSRDPDTPDMFEEDGGSEGDEDDPFEDAEDELPF